jgi:hypothetical protein
MREAAEASVRRARRKQSRDRRKFQREVAVAAQSELPVYGESPTDKMDAGEILLDEIRWTATHIEWLRANIQLSDPEMFVRSLWLRGRQSGFVKESEVDTSDWSQAGALWVEMYLNERKHLASICRTALAAGLEERRVRLAEKLAERVGEAIRGMLLDLELDPDDDHVRTIVYRWLLQAQGLDTPSPSRTRSTSAEVLAIESD